MGTFLVMGLQSCLRLFGAFWIFGGFLTLQAARESLFMDNAIAAISLEKQDKLLSYYLFLGGILTLVTGSTLVLASRWTFVPLTLLIYFPNNLFCHSETPIKSGPNPRRKGGCPS